MKILERKVLVKLANKIINEFKIFFKLEYYYLMF